MFADTLQFWELGGLAAGFHAVAHLPDGVGEEAVVVGVNRFVVDEEKSIPIQRIDESLERKQVERLRAMRARRDPGPWQAALQQIEVAARSGENLMPRILAAVEANATVGEISDRMRTVFGEYKEAVVI